MWFSLTEQTVLYCRWLFISDAALVNDKTCSFFLQQEINLSTSSTNTNSSNHPLHKCAYKDLPYYRNIDS